MSEYKTLYHYPLCPFSRKIRLILKEKDIPFGLITQIPWEIDKAFLRVNPVGTLPVIVESDGHVLADHTAIAEYLNETKSTPNLLGETPKGRAEVRRLTNWFDTAFYTDVFRPLVSERVFKALQTGGSPDSGLIRIGRENLKRYLIYTDWLCARRSYLGGKNLSFADLGAAAHLSVLDYLGEIAWDRYPDLKEWYARIKSRKSFNALLQDKIVGIIPSSNYANLDF